ncbi:TCP-1/cpn60 chaperonin family-domain-containing protein [Epithele typhae]|uniref:TCP-1/cpn60 chaperonin family-domain-containing protein n=1 Tax=Epithele typhae TaxID=378194 RepID=UPI002008A63E|nr:TCP-1/cpn60 chaperonin family-domain-containing protein [Epithele typhae]KAH9935107.1 TCP-1/cpn60 chaperonin family-domain-containing protein [Epithele typhae]
MSGLEDAVLRNIQAVAELSDLVRTSFGPNGRNKLVINHLGRLFVTSDAATIIREIEVVHPAAKLLVMASQAQSLRILPKPLHSPINFMGDSTNTVVILAGEMLKKSEQLLIMGLHPSEVIKGYELASAKALAELDNVSRTALKPAIASKQYGFEDQLAGLVAEASLAVMPPNLKNFNVDNVRVVKIMGEFVGEQGAVKKVQKGKVAVFTCGLDIWNGWKLTDSALCFVR